MLHRRLIALTLLLIALAAPLAHSGQAQTGQEIFTPSGRTALRIPADWFSQAYPEEQEIRGLDSEALVMATDESTFDRFIANRDFDGTVIFWGAYPYHVFTPGLLGDPAAMFSDVTVFDPEEVTEKTYGAYGGAEFYFEEPGAYFIMEVLIDTGQMANRATVYSTRLEDKALVDEILASAAAQDLPPNQIYDPNGARREVQTEDGRLSLQIPANWLYWNEGKTSLAFASDPAAYASINYAFRPEANPGITVLNQRMVLSALRPEEIKAGRADLPALMTRLRAENGGLQKDTPFISGDLAGNPTLEATWLVQGPQQTVLTRTRLLDLGDSVYILQAQYNPQLGGEAATVLDTIFGSLAYTPPTTPLVAGQEGVEIGQTLPDFLLNTLEGQEVRLSDYRGQVVMVNLWATWCGPCHKEAPIMQDFYEAYAGQFEILAVNVGESRFEAQDFVDTYALSFPVLLDSMERVARALQLEAYPTTYLISREGVVMERIEGSFSEQGLRDLLAIYVGPLPR
jgi:thiol-disulfide isomerase/thioredoxin